MRSRSRCLRIVKNYTLCALTGHVECFHICVGLCIFLVQTWEHVRALVSGRASMYDSRAFFMYKVLFLNLILTCLVGSRGKKYRRKTMPRFTITTKHVKNSNGIRIEPGMQVEVVSNSFSNPVITNGGKTVADAFMRIYGIDIKKAGCLNMVELDVKQMNY